MAVDPGDGLHRRDSVSAAAIGFAVKRLHIHHLRLRKYLRTMFFGEVEVIQVESVFRAMAATHHAAAATFAGGALRAFAVEVGVRHRYSAQHSLGRLENGDTGAVKGVAYSDGVGGRFQQAVRW